MGALNSDLHNCLYGSFRWVRFLTYTTKKTKNPLGALGVVSIVAFLILGAFILEPTANQMAALVIQFGAYLILIAYLMTVVGAFVFVLKTTKSILPLLILALGVAILAFIIYKTFSPFPAASFSYVVFGGGLWVLMGVGLTLVPTIRSSMVDSSLLVITRALYGGSSSPL